MEQVPSRGSWVLAGLSVVCRPALWPTALRQLTRSSRPRWWRRPPFLPIPDRAYVRFRLETQYGTHGAPASRDLVTYLEWCRGEHENTASARTARR
ncbi:MAG: hypothetical protein EXQ79_02140 [Acidimicrobiia bacterium]|nr:hypothetical protein [Acidimicrobiia bacterium]